MAGNGDGKLALMLKANRDADLGTSTFTTELTVKQMTPGGITSDVTVTIQVPVTNIIDEKPQWSTSTAGSFITVGSGASPISIMVNNKSAFFNTTYYGDIILSQYSTDGSVLTRQNERTVTTTIDQDSGLAANRSDITLEYMNIYIAENKDSPEDDWVELWDGSPGPGDQPGYINYISSSASGTNPHTKKFNIASGGGKGIYVPTDRGWYGIDETDTDLWTQNDINNWTGATGASSAMFVIKFRVYNTGDDADTQSSEQTIKIYDPV